MKIVKNVLNKSSGFTLLETLFSIMLVTLMMSILPLIFQSVHTLDGLMKTDQDYEWNLFIIGLRKELEKSEQVNVVKVNTNTSLILEKRDQVITYERYGRSLRRQVNKLGHEIVLQEIQHFEFLLNGDELELQVEFIDGLKDGAGFTIKEAESF
ncbi:competence type IV pilus minor pilin ComGF [Bacillus sp. SD088]|uniref:competence type IV pilus minor pilin ComGF n=1 Tax=Bacillus sp. SD088 TaxID=2782012 RepID=UPI001A95B63E|nr:competence type IV pilus minor pilin ComGF [Bacillus sp. SD088]MBO0995256.1 ComGF family competence protein [Bacillus sp. SD088]